jgi:sarcosine oxidase
MNHRPSSYFFAAMQTYDVIVIGTGGVGSAALFHLAKRGVKVLGLDRFPPGHDRGSSHGRTRIIRQAYFEHPDYVPLLLRAYELWVDLSRRGGKPLYHEIGLLEVGSPSGNVIPGVRQAARQHRLEIESLSPTEATRRFPAFRIPDDYEALFERRAGYLEIENCVLAHLAESHKLGAELRTEVTVRNWNAVDNEVIVETDDGKLRAKKLVISAGAWAGSLLGDLGVQLIVRRKPVFWYPAAVDSLRADSGCPVYLFELPKGVFYGIPQIDDQGFKVAQHTGGQEVSDPLTVNRELDAFDQAQVESFLSNYIPGVGYPMLHHSVCLYTMSPDENFIVDVHPRHPQVCFAAGLSGHGFKFTCVLGEALADLAVNGCTDLPIGFLNCRRFGTC